ncbi:hypothetical protein EC973_003378 [Apophysomyces ossiformis]|uniref:Uncharacterized protein n=1 Tax=Apophysomyces ossiformis TaxID=679940 RepID=A0A8H7BVS8_9FUNG|nr:hypothetical protein EC973_003378 [Apophysomyces ossiformis]
MSFSAFVDVGHSGETLLKVRYCKDREADTFFEWRGSVFAYLPGQPPKKVFECLGMNVSKAYIENGKLLSTSRELTYFLDPVTHQKLDKWENPWTEEKLPVIHIANDPVQMALPSNIPLDLRLNPHSKIASIVAEVPLFYPNPLATPDGKFDAYDPNKMYQAGEFFTFRCSSEDLEKSVIDNVDVNWTRMCRFAPFMKMGSSPGYLIFHCTGYKLPNGSTYKQLDPLLVNEIEQDMVLYKEAPSSYDPNVKSVSSWSYFRQHYDRYDSDRDAKWPVPT